MRERHTRTECVGLRSLLAAWHEWTSAETAAGWRNFVEAYTGAQRCGTVADRPCASASERTAARVVANFEWRFPFKVTARTPKAYRRVAALILVDLLSELALVCAHDTSAIEARCRQQTEGCAQQYEQCVATAPATPEEEENPKTRTTRERESPHAPGNQSLSYRTSNSPNARPRSRISAPARKVRPTSITTCIAD